VFFPKDPRPYFFGVVGDNKKEDIVAQQDLNPTKYKLDINSGFMFWRHTPLNLHLAQALIKEPLDWLSIDQTRVNDLFFDRGIHVTLLSLNQFPNGNIMYRKEDDTGILMPLSNDTVVAHANWNKHLDEKIDILKKHGLWFLSNNEEGTRNAADSRNKTQKDNHT
jgi:Nucleotide-diphospho-sugar transferase